MLCMDGEFGSPVILVLAARGRLTSGICAAGSAEHHVKHAIYRHTKH